MPAVQSLRAEARLLDGLRAAAAGELLAARRVRELAPDLAEPAAHASQAWLAAGDLGEAARWLDQWLETDPHNPVALGRAAEVAARLGHDVRARALVDRALEPPPGSGEGWLAIGDAAAALGDRDLAFGAYAAALASDSFDSPAAQLRIAEAAGDANALFPQRDAP
ncbi:MAG TPA: tetratricopeptide repeat protein [Acidimicrobiales bacterium]|nr:tetratricopeptide repeat protein [Acidimicrobiales bacterium]